MNMLLSDTSSLVRSLSTELEPFFKHPLVVDSKFRKTYSGKGSGSILKTAGDGRMARLEERESANVRTFILSAYGDQYKDRPKYMKSLGAMPIFGVDHQIYSSRSGFYLNVGFLEENAKPYIQKHLSEFQKENGIGEIKVLDSMDFLL